jgi:hypothetical protein
MKTAQRAARGGTGRRHRKGPVLSGAPSGLPRESAWDGTLNRDCCGWSIVITILPPLCWILNRHPRMTGSATIKVPLHEDFGNAKSAT